MKFIIFKKFFKKYKYRIEKVILYLILIFFIFSSSFIKTSYCNELNSSPWPMRGGDRSHTGTSPYNGPIDGKLKWSIKTDDLITSSPAIASDGTIYIGSWDKNLYAITPEGQIKWG